MVTLGPYTYSERDLSSAFRNGMAHSQVTQAEVDVAMKAGDESPELKAAATKVLNFLGCACCGHPIEVCDC